MPGPAWRPLGWRGLPRPAQQCPPHPWGEPQSQAYPDCPARTWGHHVGSWPLELGRDSSQVSEDSWVPGGGGECRDRQKGGPAVTNETDFDGVQ